MSSTALPIGAADDRRAHPVEVGPGATARAGSVPPVIRARAGLGLLGRGRRVSWALALSLVRVLTVEYDRRSRRNRQQPKPKPCQEASMKLQPLEDRIVVRSSEPEETTVSGLVIPDTAKEKPQQGEVLAVGPGRRSEQPGELIPSTWLSATSSCTRSTAGPRSPSTARTF